ncbi:MAG TPA: sigma-70 family RNA polymerase sigma factor [Clostridia bacterium]|nr:sigma-70 family RNA polymerase sigma factor [Clostridia bacterium]
MEYVYKDLVERAKAGCKESMGDLIERLRPLIYSVINRYRDRGDMEDLFQDACILIMEAVRDYDEEKGVPFLGFVKSRVYFGIHNKVRRCVFELSLDRPYGDEDGLSPIDTLEDDSIDIEESLINEETSVMLGNAIGELTLKQRGIIRGYYLEGRTLKEMAAARGVHYKAVVQLKARAMEVLRDKIKDSI